jgi:hypothetical protein
MSQANFIILMRKMQMKQNAFNGQLFIQKKLHSEQLNRRFIRKTFWSGIYSLFERISSVLSGENGQKDKQVKARGRWSPVGTVKHRPSRQARPTAQLTTDGRADRWGKIRDFFFLQIRGWSRRRNYAGESASICTKKPALGQGKHSVRLYAVRRSRETRLTPCP